MKITLETSGEHWKFTLETSGEDWKITLGTSREDVSIQTEHLYFLFLCCGFCICLDFLHSFRVYFHILPTLFECIFTSSPLVSSVFSHLLHSFRVYFHIFSTRFECIFLNYVRLEAVLKLEFGSLF